MVMSRKKIFTVRPNETAEDTIGRLGWHGSRSTLLSSGGQDWWLYHNHARFLHRRGVYIDLATNDPIARNNNYFNDVCLHWRGLCFEPNPLHHERIRATRGCQLVPTCVSHRTGSSVSFGTGKSKTFGGNAQLLDGSKNVSASHESIITLQCTTLASALERAGLTHVDFLSLDVEGAELSALLSFDFRKHKVDIIMAEDSARDGGVENLLVKTLGYRKLPAGVLNARRKGGDSVYLRPNFTLAIERLPGGRRFDHPRTCVPENEAREKDFRIADEAPKSSLRRLSGVSTAAISSTAPSPSKSASKCVDCNSGGNWSYAAFRHAVATSLVPDDHANFQEATGTTVMQLLDLIGATRDVGALVSNITSNTKVFTHPLNSRGLHAFRSLMAERLHDRIRQQTVGAQSEGHPLSRRFRRDGFLVLPIDIVGGGVAPIDSINHSARVPAQVARVLRKLSGWKRPWIEGEKTKLTPIAHFEGDIQHYAHVDTHSQCLKAFIWAPGTTLAHGPLHYVNGSHRNTEGKLRWLFDRTRFLTGLVPSAPPPASALTGPTGVPFSDWTHGFHRSIRFEGFVPQGPPSGRDWSREFGRYGLRPPMPMLLPGASSTAPPRSGTLVVADTSGFHYRGWAPPGAIRVHGKLHSAEANRMSAWACLQRVGTDVQC